MIPGKKTYYSPWYQRIYQFLPDFEFYIIFRFGPENACDAVSPVSFSIIKGSEVWWWVLKK